MTYILVNLQSIKIIQAEHEHLFKALCLKVWLVEVFKNVKLKKL